MAIIWPLAVSINCFDTFLLHKRFRSLYVLIVESIIDSIPFLVILIFICMVFALIGQMMNIGLYEFMMVEKVILVFLEALGDFTAPSQEVTKDGFKRSNQWFVFLML